MTLFITLPDDCVQLIFDRIPTRNLLLGRRVCRAWHRHQKLNCHRRKTLIILHGSWPYDIITESFFIKKFAPHNIDQNGNSLNYESFIEHYRIHSTERRTVKVNYLVQTFPSISTLIIASDRTLSAHLRSFNELIANYSSQLVSLQMYFDDEIKTSAQQKSVSIIVGNLMNQLNSLSALEHFTFDSPWKITFPIDAPEFLTRIKEFYFKCFGLRAQMGTFLRKYEREGRLAQLSRINLAQRCSEMESSKDLSTNKFDQWPLCHLMPFIPYNKYYYRMFKDRLISIMANFPSLTIISIDYELCLARPKCKTRIFDHSRGFTRNLKLVSLSELAHFLSPLTKLVLLKLTIGHLDILTEPLEPLTTPQLKSIKALEVDFGEDIVKDCSMFANKTDTFVHIFPNLRSIRVITDEQYEDKSDNFTLSARHFLGDLKRAYGRDSLEITVANHFERPFKL